ncbi:hypothetical protein JNUCC42_02750 [Brevibacterium sp. JNUCC-42]|nr:hypothetical protein JNUCC42_02750 [Brevibacterium sp. JNUCC-42]
MLMSFKALELQHAIPRTQEIGRWQEQLQQRAAAEQQQIKEEQKRLNEAKRNKTENVHKSEHQQVKNNQEESAKKRGGEKGQTKDGSAGGALKAHDHPSIDPIRGHHIDISL